MPKTTKRPGGPPMLMLLLSCLGVAALAAAATTTAATTTSSAAGSLPGERATFEAAFQGRCGHGSPCEQLCYELHDGMYECDCREGFLLHRNGYSCAEMNLTSPSAGPGSATAPASRPEQRQSQQDVLYVRGASITIHLGPPAALPGAATSTESNEIPEAQRSAQTAQTKSTSSTERGPSCSLDCGPGGVCYVEPQSYGVIDDLDEEESAPSPEDLDGDAEGPEAPFPEDGSGQRCQCPLGRGGSRCQRETEVRSPRFSGSSWLAFPALRAAYKHVQLELEFRPEAWDGVLLLTGERDDLQGDFMALILHRGYLEFRFDCGSGVGIVRSSEPVRLNKWNALSVYRHRWDAWLQLNQEKRVQGRSKGLFSRITFREPLYIGGPGNTSGLERLPVKSGFRGCVRNLEINDHHYHFPLAPRGDALSGFDVEKCSADRCSKVPCSHGGKCLTTGGDSAVCLCPLGYTGDLCETRLDLQVPSFNGSSYLRYPGLAESSLSWLELAVTIKPLAGDGVILYNGHHSDATGDFVGLYLAQGYLHFSFDLGTGCATLRSASPVRLGEWLEARVSRTGRLASLEVEGEPAQEVLAPGAFTQLSLPLNLYLGGAPNPDMYSPKMRTKASFLGCVQAVVLNGREVGILAEALGGANVGNCGHACEARPCGDAECRPLRERFTCRCRPGFPHPCPALLGSAGPARATSAGRPTEAPRHGEDDGDSAASSLLVPSFTGAESYLHYDDADTMRRLISYKLDVNMRFRASSSSGLLLWSGRQQELEGGAHNRGQQREANADFLALGLEQGYLTLAFNLGSGEARLRYNLTRLDDDLWHRVRAVRDGQRASLLVDNGNGVTVESPGQLRQLNTDTGLYVGGAPDIVRTTGGRFKRGIVGCVSDLVLDSDLSVSLSNPGQATNTHTCIP